ncbi:MAG: hypothetical protein U5K00_05060 [Melioribacteraceae bacterium]|nr:hypothetical protein [Melioribacteraceae bacterium]
MRFNAVNKRAELLRLQTEDYKPIPPEEKARVRKLSPDHILEVANRFDGCSKFTIRIHAKGNA